MDKTWYFSAENVMKHFILIYIRHSLSLFLHFICRYITGQSINQSINQSDELKDTIANIQRFERYARTITQRYNTRTWTPHLPLKTTSIHYTQL